MNWIPVFRKDFHDQDTLRLSDERFIHIKNIHKSRPGDSLKLLFLNEGLGQGKILEINANEVTIHPDLWRTPIPPLPITIIIALPRPQTVKKILELCGSYGVQEICLIQSHRIEQSYFQSPVLQETHILKHLVLGLCQGGHPHVPVVSMERKFQNIFKNHPTLLKQKPGLKILLDVEETSMLDTLATPIKKSRLLSQPILVAIGPEGGWLPNERSDFVKNGFQPICLSRSILRVEHACSAFLAQWELLSHA